MTSKIRSIRISPAMIVSCVALFLALTGSALAVGLAKNSVHSAQIANGAVKTSDLGGNAVQSAKIAPKAVVSGKLAEDAVNSSKVKDDSLTSADLGPESVRAGDLGKITLHSKTVAVPAGANGAAAVVCPEGEQVISGGGQPANFDVFTTSSRPLGNGWFYAALNTNGAASSITAYVLCLAG
jgi:trimeric autotransporter adhesin